jgi:uncharacterized membrane protein
MSSSAGSASAREPELRHGLERDHRATERTHPHTQGDAERPGLLGVPLGVPTSIATPIRKRPATASCRAGESIVWPVVFNAQVDERPDRFPLRAHLPPVVIGVGIGGFFDGIVLHQILQWHHMVSNRVSPGTLEGLQFNTLIDGVFHQAMWLITLTGVVLLYRRLAYPPPRPGPSLIGGILVGFGLFNVADSVVFHWTLNLHNIRPGPDWFVYDVGFFLWGVGMIVIGGWFMRRNTPPNS